MTDTTDVLPAETEGTEKPSAKAIKIPLKFRALIALAFFLVLVMGIPEYIKPLEWRAAVAVLALGASILLAAFVKPSPPARERVPRIEASPGVLEDLAGRAIERADRANTAWLTIVGAAHSAFLALLANPEKLGSFGTRDTAGLGLIILGFVCSSGSHMMDTTRNHAERALQIASKADPMGRYFRYVYGHDKETWTFSGLASLIRTLGRIWFLFGGMFAAVAYLKRFLA